MRITVLPEPRQRIEKSAIRLLDRGLGKRDRGGSAIVYEPP